MSAIEAVASGAYDLYVSAAALMVVPVLCLNIFALIFVIRERQRRR